MCTFATEISNSADNNLKTIQLWQRSMNLQKKS